MIYDKNLILVINLHKSHVLNGWHDFKYGKEYTFQKFIMWTLGIIYDT